MENSRSLLRICFILLATAIQFGGMSDFGGNQVFGKDPAPEFRIVEPKVILNGVPIPRLRIEKLNANGTVDESFSERLPIEGIQILHNGTSSTIPHFSEGVLQLETDRNTKTFVSVQQAKLNASLKSQGLRVETTPLFRPGWVSLIPPLTAILLAIWWKEVITALLIATIAGMMLCSANPLNGIIRTADPLVLSTLASSGNMQIIMFTMLLGGTIGIISGSGGAQAMVSRLTVFVQNRRHGQLLTWFLGLIIFFDDYGNTLLVGGTMRSVADRLRISREKLAFLVDSTAAPVAGLALISTWVGVEIGYMQTAYESVGIPTADIYQTFISTLPYRFYPILTLAFVAQIAWSGRDYGPMFKAEQNCLHSELSDDDADQQVNHHRSTLARHAVIPLVTLCVALAIFLAFDFEASSRALLMSSYVAIVAATLSVVVSGTNQLIETIDMALEGMKQMLPAVIVLVLAWSLGTVCNSENLNTAGYLVESLGDQLSASWVPCVTFLLAGVVSFATGTSYGTMGLLLPLCVGLEFQLLMGIEVPFEGIGSHPLMLATVGAVLGGAIFGDHCSPISDTTVLSSAATGCPHLDHVRTQLPYSVTVAIVTLGSAYLPVAMGISPYLAITGSIVILWLLVRLMGRDPELSPK